MIGIAYSLYPACSGCRLKSGQRKTTCSRMDEEEQVAFPLVALFRKWDFEEMHRKKYKG